MTVLLASVALAVIGLLPVKAARAQSFTWGGAGSTTTTTDYNLGTNWSNPPAGASPVTTGQSAIFDTTGSSTVVVTTGPIAPASWTLNSASGLFMISGAAVNFSLAGASGGIINNTAGTGVKCTTISTGCGNGGPANKAKLSRAYGVAVDSSGNVYIADSGDNQIR